MTGLAGGDGQAQDLTGLDGTIAGQFIFVEDGLDDLTYIRIFIETTDASCQTVCPGSTRTETYSCEG